MILGKKEYTFACSTFLLQKKSSGILTSDKRAINGYDTSNIIYKVGYHQPFCIVDLSQHRIISNIALSYLYS